MAALREYIKRNVWVKGRDNVFGSMLNGAEQSGKIRTGKCTGPLGDD